MILDLSKSVILVALGSTKIRETVSAIKHCHKLVKFFDTIYLTDASVSDQYARKIEARNIPSKKDYQYFMVNDVPSLILDNIPISFNGHFLFINWDGFIINVDAWTDEFLDYDYIGAPWPWFNHLCGNGGFCLKSKKFLSIQKQYCNNFYCNENEDVILGLKLRKVFESFGCKYADSTIGYKFSTEVGDIVKNNSFGFHDFKYHPYFKYIIQEQ
jgi:hypothetical protein